MNQHQLKNVNLFSLFLWKFFHYILFSFLIYLGGCLGNGGGGNQDQSETEQTPAVGKVELTVFDNYQPANGDSAISLLAAVRDGKNLPLSDVPIEVSTTSSTAFFVMQDKQTNEQGLAVVGFFNTKAETFDVAITSKGVKSAPISLTFITPTSGLELTTQENIVPVGGTASLTVVAHQQGSTGNNLTGETGRGSNQTTTENKPLPHAPIDIEVSGAAKVNTPTIETDEHGQATFKVTDNVAEKVTVTVKSGSITKTLPLFFGANLTLLPLMSNAIEKATLTAVLKDSDNAPLAGQTVNFSFVGKNNEILFPSKNVTSEDGTTTVTITDLEKNGGTAIVNATIGSSFSVREPATVNFLASFGENRHLEVKTSAQVLTLEQVATVTARVVDKFNEPIKGQLIKFSIDDAQGGITRARLYSSQGLTNDQGEVQTQVSDSSGENVVVNVQADTAKQKVSLYFGATLKLVPLTANGIADGTTPIFLTATVSDASGAGITGVPVNFRITQGTQALLDTFQGITNEMGRSKVGVTNHLPDRVTVQASIDKLDRTQAELTFLAPDSAVELSTHSKVLPIGKKASILVSTTQKVEKIEGAPFPHAPLMITVSGHAQLEEVPSSTDASGKASFVVSDDQAETVTVTVTSGSMTQTLVLYFGATLSLVPSSSDAVEEATLTALLKDGQNVPIVGEVITFGFIGANSKTLNPSSAETNKEGTVQVVITDIAKEQGQTIVRAQSGNLSAQATVTFKDNLLDDRVAHLKVVVSNDFQPADGKSPITLTVIALDKQNVPVSDLQVSLTSRSNNAFFEALTGKTEKNGRFTTSVTNSLAETVEVTPMAGGIQGEPVTITFISSNLDRRVSTVKLVVTNNSQAADGRSPITLTVIARDGSGMPISDVQVHFVSSSETALIEKINGSTESNGRFSTTVLSNVPETFTVTAVAGGVQSNAANLTFAAPVGTIVLRASEVLLGANGSSRITVTILRKVNLEELLGQFSEFFDYVALDSATLDSLLQKDILLPNTPFSVTVSGNAEVSDIPAATNATGQASFTVSNKQTEDVIVTVTSGSIVQTLKLYFGATLTLLPAQSNAVGSSKLKVLLNNASQSPLSGQKVNFSFEQSYHETLSPSSTTTDENGIAEVTVTDLNGDGGTSVVRATAGQLSTQATINFLAQIGENTFEMHSSATLLELGRSATITTTVKDKVGIPIVGQPISFTLTLAEGGNSHAHWFALDDPQKSSENSFLTNRKGEVQIVVTDEVGENIMVVAQIGATTQKLPLYFGATLQLLPSQGETNADGSPFALKASVQDALKGGIPDIPVRFRVQEGKALLDAFSAITDKVGVAEVNVTDQVAEKTVIEAYTDTLVAKSVIDFIGSEAPYKIVLKTDSSQDPVTLPLNGTIRIIAVVTDDRGLPVQDGIRIHFSSTGKIGDQTIGSVTESAFTQKGEAIAIFNAGTLAGLTTVDATSSIPYQVFGGQTKTATGGISLMIESGEAGTIEVKEIKPKAIGIKGSGIAQSATIQFLVKDNLGNPVKDDTEVEFSLGKTTLGGGETISVGNSDMGATSTIGKTNNGLVSVTLKSGTIAGNVDVIAKVENVSTLARVIIVGSLPDADHLSLACEYLNIAGGVRFGLLDNITAYVGDRFGNVVPDGTAVSFITEGGTIGKGLGGSDQSIPFTSTTEFGQASADLQSAGPSTPNLGGIPTFRNVGYECSGAYQYSSSPGERCGNPGWVTIVAYTTGSESFVDANGNGIFDKGDRLSAPGFLDKNGNLRWDDGEPITGQGDMSEPFIDGNDNDIFDAGELYVDVNQNRHFDGPDGVFQENTTIWNATRVLFSAETAGLEVEIEGESSTGGGFSIPDNEFRVFRVKRVGDVYGNALVNKSRFQVSSSVSSALTGMTDLSFGGSLGRGVEDIRFVVSSLPPTTSTKKDSSGNEVPDTKYPDPTPVTITISINSPFSENSPGGNGSISLVIAGTINVKK